MNSLWYGTTLLFFLSINLLSANFVFAENKAVITGTSINLVNNTVIVSWNQSVSVKECFVELVSEGIFYSPPEDPVWCVDLGLKTKTITLNNVQGVVPLYTVIIDNITGDIISDFVLVRESLPVTALSGNSDSSLKFQSVPVVLSPGAISISVPVQSKGSVSTPEKFSDVKIILPITTKSIIRNLSLGVSGDDVSLLQELLKKENVFPENLITGYFGNLTKQAVVKFQEKYAEEILVPSGLTSGTGFVGELTLKKINALLGPNTFESVPVSTPQSQNLAETFTRDLYYGLSGEDVKVLQEFLQDEKFYTGPISGEFGPVTRRAVADFQEKYSGEILAPAGLVSGSGYVGLLTRVKVEALMQAKKK